MPMIEEYEFGMIRIDGKTYRADVIITPRGVIDNWWRKEGHRLCRLDLAAALAESPELLIIGTGHSGMMKVPGSLVEELTREGIRTIVEKTGDAVREWQGLGKGHNAVAALHLTC